MRLRATGIALLSVSMLAGCKLGGEGAATSGVGGIAMVRDAAIGARYGSAGPRVCTDRRTPTEGAVSAEQAAAYAICNREGEDADDLFLVDEVRVSEVSSGWMYQGPPTQHTPGLDVRRPVYSLKGSLVVYECNRLGVEAQHGADYQRGSNCQRFDQPNADGLCFHTVEGDWRCSLVDEDERIGPRGLAPPA